MRLTSLATLAAPLSLTVECLGDERPRASAVSCELDAATAAQIRQLETQLAELLTRYTDRYPAVVALEETIKRIEADALSKCVQQPSDTPFTKPPNWARPSGKSAKLKEQKSPPRFPQAGSFVATLPE